MRDYTALMTKATVHRVEVIHPFHVVVSNQVDIADGMAKVTSGTSGEVYLVHAVLNSRSDKILREGEPLSGLTCSCKWGTYRSGAGFSFCSHTLAVLNAIFTENGYALTFAGRLAPPELFEEMAKNLGQPLVDLWDDANGKVVDRIRLRGTAYHFEVK